MCKIVIIPNGTDIPKFDVFVRKTAAAMADQKDGFGYAAQGTDGVFGLRTTNPIAFLKQKKQLPYVESASVPFGKKTKVNGAVMLHGRTSTNFHGLVNTHPIVRDKHYLIHNGVVTHHGEKYEKHTQNDSEDVLYNFIKGGINDVSQNLTGYYAASIIDDKGLLHVIKDSIANLYCAWSDKLNSPVFATTESLINMISIHIEEELVPNLVKDDTYLIFEMGKLVSQEVFASRGCDSHSAKYAERSLGFSLDGDWSNNDIYSASNPELDDASDEFLDEVEFFDHSYQFWYNAKELSLSEFYELPLREQLNCVIRRHDGSRVPTKLSDSQERYA